MHLPLTTLVVPSIFETNFSFKVGSIMVMEHWDDTHTKHSLSQTCQQETCVLSLAKETTSQQTGACPATFAKRVEDLWQKLSTCSF
jgi:hypothetical protein